MFCHRYAGRVVGPAGTLLAVVLLAGCAGNGEGLDSNGQPLGTTPGGGNSGTITADFQSLQNNVFTPICTQCHIGASAPQGLQLDQAHSYALLVNVPSNEKGSVLRVKPGDPDNSYIIQKLEGATGIVGSQMPLGQAPLPASTIAAIRQWIANGALPAASTALATEATSGVSEDSADGSPQGSPNSAKLTAKIALTRISAPTEPFAVIATAPLDGDDQLAPLSTIVVAFNHDVDASLINSSTIRLDALLPDQTARNVTVIVRPAGANPGSNASAVVILPSKALGAGTYRVTVRGTGGGAVADLNAQPLGSDVSFVFTVSPAQ